MQGLEQHSIRLPLHLPAQLTHPIKPEQRWQTIAAHAGADIKQASVFVVHSQTCCSQALVLQTCEGVPLSGIPRPSVNLVSSRR